MSEGFLSRWSKRKVEVRTAESVATSEVPKSLSDAVLTAKVPETPRQSARLQITDDSPKTNSPTLPDIETLKPDSDFTPFMQRDVSTDVRNQAMKKLFADPAFNVMDGLDVYIDDYGKPDPIPEAWYAGMARIAGDWRGPEQAPTEDNDAAGQGAAQTSDEGAQVNAAVSAEEETQLQSPTKAQTQSQTQSQTQTQTQTQTRAVPHDAVIAADAQDASSAVERATDPSIPARAPAHLPIQPPAGERMPDVPKLESQRARQ
jgi:hypothetical protein